MKFGSHLKSVREYLAKFGYLDFEAEQVTERGRWLADLHVDRPLLVGEALERGLFGAIDSDSPGRSAGSADC